MLIGPIGMDPELILDMIKKVTDALDAYPDPDRIRQTTGPSGDIADNFHSPLKAGARSVAVNSEELRKELVSLDSAIRASMKDFTAQDDAVAEEADKFLKILDDAKAQAPADQVPTSPSTPQPATTPSTSTSGGSAGTSGR